MTEAYAYMQPTPRITSFAGQRLHELKTIIENAQNESKMWEEILGKISACKTCGGRGDVKHYPDGMEDGPRFKKCTDCGGTGDGRSETINSGDLIPSLLRGSTR